MAGIGGYIWFIGLGACLVVLVVGYLIGDASRKKRAAGNPNNAWQQAAAETGHPEIAKPNRDISS